MPPRVNKELQEKIEPHVADPYSDEGQDEIHDPDNTHVAEIWEDGEITVTKCGDLYRNRHLHQANEPVTLRNELIWRPDEDSKHVRKVVIDREAVNNALREYAREHQIYVRGLKCEWAE